MTTPQPAPHPRPGTREIAYRAYDGRAAVWQWRRFPTTEEEERPVYGWMLIDVKEKANG